MGARRHLRDQLLRLQEVKARYDPGNVFNQTNQTVVPAGPDPSRVSFSNPQLGSASGQ